MGERVHSAILHLRIRRQRIVSFITILRQALCVRGQKDRPKSLAGEQQGNGYRQHR